MGTQAGGVGRPALLVCLPVLVDPEECPGGRTDDASNRGPFTRGPRNFTGLRSKEARTTPARGGAPGAMGEPAPPPKQPSVSHSFQAIVGRTVSEKASFSGTMCGETTTGVITTIIPMRMCS